MRTFSVPSFLEGRREYLAVRRNGQGPFLPHAMLKTKGESKCKSCWILHSSDLNIEKFIVMFKNEERMLDE